LVTEIPGPNSTEIVKRREAAMPAGAAKLTQIAVRSAHGSTVTDVDGNTFIDLAGGIGVLAAGHTPGAVVEAIQRQAADLVHMCAIVSTYEPLVEVCELLNEITPGDFAKKTVLMNSGAEAVETAVNIARSATGRQGVVVFDGAYHGRTNLTMAMTSKFNLFKKGFGPFAPEVYRFPFPNVYRRPDGMGEDEFVAWHVANLDHCFTAIVDPSHVACLVVEPVQGEAGFVAAPTPWLHRLRELCDQHGIVMVADEIQSGFGRTGTLFAIEHSGVVPDLVTMAKSLGAGMPISAVTGRAELMDAPHPGGLGGTYSGNPLACVAAREAINQIRTPEFLARSKTVGARMRAKLEQIQAKHPAVIGDVRGVGSMLVMELVHDAASRQPWMELASAITAATVERGVISIRAGLYSNCVRFLPPLVITDEELDEAFGVLEAAVDSAVAALS
jgi:4-aminobutyrate aminotransferase/(S)-3-amino-2-methylpropionate transaminase